MSKINEIFQLFFKLGIIAFGGPAAHIAMVHKEIVEERKWMDNEHFLDLVGATSLIPGPNSTEMVIHCGFHRAGVKGLFVAGASFIFPACLLSGILAYFYTQAVQIPSFDQYLIGIRPIVLILIFQALKKLYKKAVSSYELAFVAIIVFLLGFTPISHFFSLIIGALLAYIIINIKVKNQLKSIEPISILLVFGKIGSILFGSGYVLISYLQYEVVEMRGWLTSSQIADAVAIGQFTPGPVLSTSTFIGYLLGNTQGAILATIGIFLPSFLFVYILNPLIPKMRNSQHFSLFLDGVNASAIGLMAYALIPLGKECLSVPALITLLLGVLIIYLKPKTSSLKLVLFGVITGTISNIIVNSF